MQKLKWQWVCHCRIISRGVGVPSPIVLAAQLWATTAQARCLHTNHRDSSGHPQVTSGMRLSRGSWLAATGHFFIVIWHQMSHIRSSSCWSPRLELSSANTGTVLVAFFTVVVFIMLLTSRVRKMGLIRVGQFPLSYCSKDVQKSIMVPGLIEHNT
jgi:hypothetical protein